MSEFWDSLKISVLGTKSTKIDQEIDASLDSIETFTSKNSVNRYMETMRNIVSSTGQDDATENEVLKNVQGSNQIEFYEQSGRIPRYKEYDALVHKISYCQRALTTITDNIISPDDITKRSLLFVPDDAKEDSTSILTVISRLKEIEKRINFEDKISDIVKRTLKKGDHFLEILHSPKGEHGLTILREDKELGFTDNESVQIGDSIKLEGLDDLRKLVIEDVDEDESLLPESMNVVVEASSYSGGMFGMPFEILGSNPKNKTSTFKGKFTTADKEDPLDDDTFKSKFAGDESTTGESAALKDIFIAQHQPQFVIRLETERFKSCLGYLIFPKIDGATLQAPSFASSSMNTVDALCLKIIQNLEKSLQNKNDKIKVSDDMRTTILQHVLAIKNNDDLKIRYIPPDRMVHWRINVDRFDPYGESIFECVNFDGRLLVALKTATTIKQVTSAADKRIVYVETGLPRDATQVINAMKEAINKKKHSIDSMGSIDTIPSQIQTFDTIYIPQRDGKRFVEFDNQQWGPQPNNDTEDLKFMRDNIVANLGVPAPFLGLEENVSNRSLLTVENINFARTIISFQKELSIPLKELFSKIYQLIYPNDTDELDFIKVTFQEPKISPYEHQMEYVQQVQQLIEAMHAWGVPMDWLKKQYLPHLPWDIIEKAAAEEKIKKETSEEGSQDDSAMAGMGGMGGGY